MFGFRFLNDKTILQLIKTGNEEALTMLYARTFKKVYRYVFSKRGKIKDAEDVMAEALLAVWQQVIRQKTGQSFALVPYVLAVARNRWNKKYRKKGKKQGAASAEEQPGQPIITLTDTWGNLSEQDRRLLGYYYYDGFTAKEIAELTGMPGPDAVRQRKSELIRGLIGEKNIQL